MATNLKTQLPKYFEITPGYNKLRVGHITDSIIIVDEPKYDCYILAGISQNQIFSKVLMKNMDINKGILYDINIPNNIINYPDNTNIIKKNVGYILDNDLNKSNTSDLREIIQQYDNVFLKMDIRGDEYVWLLSLPNNALNSFKQMVITFNDVNYNPTKTRAINKIKCFNKIIETHNIAHTQYKGINEHNSKLIITYIRKDVICKNKVDTNVVQDEKQLEAEEAQKQLEAEEAQKQLEAEEAQKRLEAEEAQKHLEAEEAQKQLEAEEAQKQLEAEEAQKQLEAEEAQKQLEAEEAQKQLEAEEAQKQLEAERIIKQQAEEEQRQLEAEEAQKQLEAEEAQKQLEAERIIKQQAEEEQRQLEAERIIKQQAEEEQRLLEAEEAQKQIEAEEAQKESETHNVVPNNQEDFKKMADDKEAEELRKKLEAEELLIQEEKAKQIAKKIADDKEAEELRKKLEAEQLAND